MNNKRIATGFVGAAIMCATNTIVVHAEESPIPTTVNAPTEPGQEQQQIQLLSGSSSSSLATDGILSKIAGTTKNSPAMELGNYSTPGKSKEFISRFKKEAQLVEGSQGKPDLEGVKEFDFTQSDPPVKIAPDAKERLFKAIPSAFVDPSGNSVLNLTLQSPTIATDLSIEDAKKYGWTEPGEKEVEKWDETTTVADYDNPVVSLPRFNFKISADPNKIQFKDPSEQGYLYSDGTKRPLSPIMTRITKGKSVFDKRGNFLRVTEGGDLVRREPLADMSSRYAYGVSEMFNAGEYFEYEMPVENNSKWGTTNGYIVLAPGKIVIDRRQEYGTPSYSAGEKEGTYKGFTVSVKNTGNVAVGGYTITAPDGTRGEFIGGENGVLQPGETGTLRVPYTPKPGEKVSLKVSASNQAEKTIEASKPELHWDDNLTFAGKQVSDKTPIRVKPDTQLLFQAGVKNTGTGSATSFDIVLPNGKKTTLNQEVKAGETTTVKIPYTPAKDETNLTFKISSNGQFQKTYTATIQQETPQPTTKNKPTPPTGSDDGSTTTETPGRPSLGTLQIKHPVEIGSSFRLPLEQIKNTTNKPWANMYIMSEDGKYFASLDDKDALVVVRAGSNFPDIGLSLPDFTPQGEKQYTGEQKPRFFIYSDVPEKANDLKKIEKRKFVQDYGTLVGTFDVEIPDLIKEMPNFFKESGISVNGTPSDALNLMPGKEVSPRLILKERQSKEKLAEGLRVTSGEMTVALKRSGDTDVFYQDAYKYIKVQAPEGKEGIFKYTVKSGNSDVSYGTKTIKTYNVLKDDSKVPNVKAPVEIVDGFVRANVGDVVVFRSDDFDKELSVYDFYDTNGNSLKRMDNGGVRFMYEVKPEDIGKSKRVYLTNGEGIVVGKMDMKFSEKYNSPMIELGSSDSNEGHYGQTFKHELLIRNYTTKPWSKAYVSYVTLGDQDEKFSEKQFDIKLDEPLQPGDSTKISVDIEPAIKGLNKYHGYFVLENTGTDSTTDRTQNVSYSLSPKPLSNGENPFEFTDIKDNTMLIWPGETTKHTVKSELGRRFPVQIVSPDGKIIERDNYKSGNPDVLVYEKDYFSFSYTPTEKDMERGSATFKFLDKSTGEVVGSQTITYMVVEESNKYVKMKVNARFETNKAEPVSVDVDPNRGILYEIVNTGSAPMTGVTVNDTLVNKNTGESFKLDPKPMVDFNGTLLAGQKIAYVAELPEGLDMSAEYTNGATAVGKLPQRVHRGRALLTDVDYGDDPSSTIIISPRRDKSSSLLVSDNIREEEIYVRADRPQDIVIEENKETYTRTYKNPDGTIIQISPDEVIFKPSENTKYQYRHRTGKPYIEKVGKDGRYEIFENDVVNRDKLPYGDPNFIGTTNKTEVLVRGGSLPAIHVDGMHSIARNFPYIVHNKVDFNENVIGATASDTKQQVARDYVWFPSEASAFEVNGASIEMKAASAQSKGPGTYEEELEILDQVTFLVEKVKISYTIHPDGTATVNFIDSPEGMEFDVALYRQSETGDDVHVDEQGRIHGSNDSEIGAERPKNSQAGKEDALIGSGEEEPSDSSITNRARSVLAATGTSSGVIGVALLALVSLLGAIAVIRRGNKKD